METLIFTTADSANIKSVWLALANGQRILRHGFGWDIRSVNVSDGVATVSLSRDFSGFGDPGISVQGRG